MVTIKRFVGSVTSQKLFPMFIIVGNSGEILRSADIGLAWSSQTNPFGIVNINAVASNRHDFIAVGDGGNAAKSSDGGITWGSLLTTPIVTNLTSVGANGNVFIAGSLSGEIIRSSDAGLNWTVISTPFFGGEVTGIKHNNNGIWVACVSTIGTTNRVIRSTDDGLTWTGVSVSGSANTDQFNGLAYNGRVFIISGQDPGSTKGLAFVSTDDGATWTQEADVASAASQTEIATSGNTQIIVGQNHFIKSVSDGTKWSARRPITPIIPTNLNAVAFQNNIFISCDSLGKIFRSSDAGSTWTSITNPSVGSLNGIASSKLLPFAASQTTPTIIISGVGGMMRRSTDGGKTFSANITTPITTSNILELEHSDATGTTIAVEGGGGGNPGKIIRSTNEGISWTTVDLNPGQIIKEIAFDNAGTWWAISSTNQLYKSTDDGVSWSTTTPGLPTNPNEIAFGNGALIIIGGIDNSLSTIGRSTDGGVTWTNITHPPLGDFLRGLGTDGNGTWITGSDSGVSIYLRSTDNGLTWTSNVNPFGTAAIRAIQFFEGTWIIGSEASVVGRSDDGGLTWTITQAIANATFEIAAFGNKTWVAAGSGGQLAISHDDGRDFGPIINAGGVDVQGLTVARVYTKI